MKFNTYRSIAIANLLAAVTCIIIAITLFTVEQFNKPKQFIYTLPKSCETIIKIDQNVKENIKDNFITGDTDRLIKGTDEYYNAQFEDCMEYKVNGKSI